MPFRVPVFLALLMVPLAVWSLRPVAAQNGGARTLARQVDLVRTTERIVLDGRLDDPAWATAVVLDDILQREPNPGAPATERTEVRLLYDREHLHVGVRCFDSEPNRVIGTQMTRDADLEPDDRVELLLDTFHDRRNAFYFATNPAGALVDGLIVENGDLNLDWNGIWNVRARRDDRGWTAEFAIPFKTLSFNAGQPTWGFNFSRTIVRKVEEDRWAAPRLDIDFVQVSEAGEISGFSQTEQGIGLDARPYVVGRWIRDAAGNNRFEGDIGGDFFYNLTPSLRLTGTINTDFAETEVDNRQINLTRFPLFFPEKRTYFLENVGVFNLAQTTSFLDPPFIPFFSRRIGLRDGTEVPIDAGIKLTGKVGKYDVGALLVRTRETRIDGQRNEAKNFLVGRVKRNFLKQSYLGGWYTQGNPEGTAANRLFGTDLRLATADFLGTGKNFVLDAHAFGVRKEGATGDSSAYGVGVAYPNDRYFAVAEWKRVERNFDPALGFVTRPANDTARFGVEFNPRLKRSFLNIRQMNHYLYFSHFRRNDLGATETWRWFIAPIAWDFNSGASLEVNLQPQKERLFLPFEIAPDVVLPAGDYRFTRYEVNGRTPPRYRAQLRGSVRWGTFWSGRATDVSVGITYRWAPRLTVNLSADQTFARLREGSFVTRIVTLRADYAVSPLLTVSNFVQYDNDSRSLGWQSRLRWIVKPGNDLFFVFNQGWRQDPGGGFRFSPSGSRITSKVQYTFRF